MELLHAAVVVPVDQPMIRDGAVVMDGEKILAVGAADVLRAQYGQAQQTHYPKGVLLPGLINAHMHIDIAAFSTPAIVATPGSDTSAHLHWLKSSLEMRANPRLEAWQSAIRETVQRLPKFGVTTLGAMTSYDAAMPLIGAASLRAVVYMEIYASLEHAATQDRFESALALIEQYAGKYPLVKVGLAPLAPYLVSRQLLSLTAAHAKSEALPLAIHAAESFEEMEFFFNSSGPIGTQIFPLFGWGPTAGKDLPPPFQKTPIAYLDELGFLAAAPTIIDPVHLSHDDAKLLAARGCTAVYSAQAVKHFGLGELPLGKVGEAGVTVALGTESLLTCVDGDLWSEMRAMLHHGGASAEAILRMATLGGAQALKLEGTTGSLTVGKAADLVVADLPTYDDDAQLLAQLIRLTGPQNIRRTVVAGETVYHT